MLYAASRRRRQRAATRRTRRRGTGQAGTALTPAAAWYVTDILRGLTLPEPFAQLPALGGRRAIAFKTGTSYGFRDAWAIGSSDRYTIGVWTGRPDGAPRPGHYGIASAAPILFKLFGLLPGEEEAKARPCRRAADGERRDLACRLAPFLGRRPSALRPMPRPCVSSSRRRTGLLELASDNGRPRARGAQGVGPASRRAPGW